MAQRPRIKTQTKKTYTNANANDMELCHSLLVIYVFR